jgi:hypothetical protein
MVGRGFDCPQPFFEYVGWFILFSKDIIEKNSYNDKSKEIH